MPDRTFAVHHRNLLVEQIAPFLPHRLGLPVLDTTLYAILSRPSSIAQRALRHYSSHEAARLAEARRTESGAGEIVLYLMRKTLPEKEFPEFFADAVRFGSPAVVEAMLRAGLRPANIFNWSAFGYAVEHRKLEVTKLLLDYGADVDLYSPDKGFDVLYAAVCTTGNVEMTRLLLDRGGSVHLYDGRIIQEVVASNFGLIFPDMVKFLLEYCGNIDLSDTVRHGIIRSAATGFDPAIFEHVLNYGWDVHFEDDEILRDAMQSGCMDNAKLLIERGIVQPSNDARLFFLAVDRGSITMMKLLLDIGIGDPNEEFFAGARHDRVDILDLLLDRGADIHKGGDLALCIVAARCGLGSVEAIQLLLDRGADIHANEDAALREAALFDHWGNIVRCLLDGGADIHARNDEALVNSHAQGHEYAVQILLERGADMTVLKDAERIAQVRRTMVSQMEAYVAYENQLAWRQPHPTFTEFKFNAIRQ